MKKNSPFVRLIEQAGSRQNIQKFIFLYVLLMFFYLPICVFSQSQIITNNDNAIYVTGDALIFDASTNTVFEPEAPNEFEFYHAPSEKCNESKLKAISGKKSTAKAIFSKEFSNVEKEKARIIEVAKPAISFKFTNDTSSKSSVEALAGFSKTAVSSRGSGKDLVHSKFAIAQPWQKLQAVYLQQKYFYVAHFSSYNFSTQFSVRPPPVA